MKNVICPIIEKYNYQFNKINIIKPFECAVCRTNITI